jgi:hypothetical protein
MSWVFLSFSVLAGLLGLVWLIFGISFFRAAAEYYRTENRDRAKKHEQMSELLAKFDQLVDVLKVK